MSKLAKDQTWSKAYPQLADITVKSVDCTSPERFQQEVDLVFRKTWLYAGHVMDLAKPGAFLIKEFQAPKASLLLTRGQDNVVRAFHNVCRHRCAKLVASGRHGNASRFTCEFHGWTYDSKGALIGVPDAEGVPGDRENQGLLPVHCSVWNGFIFVCLDPTPRQTFEEFLGEFATHPVNNYPFDLEWESWGWKIEVKANWKVVRDLFAEGYHVAFVHANTVNTLYGSSENPYYHLPVVSFYGPHYKLTGAATEGQSKPAGPIGALSVKYGGVKTSRYGKARDAHPGINPEGIRKWALDEYGFFPNFMVNIFGGLWHYHSFEPLAADRSIWENRIFFPKATNAGERFAHEYSQSLQTLLGTEDMSAAERVYAGMETGAVSELILHDQEIALRFAHKTIEDYMQAQMEPQQ